MATNDDSEAGKVLEASIEELRRIYDHITNIYDQLRIKALALIAGEVAIVTFIFTGYQPQESFIPEGADRQIFFFGGIIALVIAFGFLLWLISSVPWKLAHDSIKARKILEDYPSKEAFLIYLNDYYVDVNNYCVRLVTNKCKKFNWVVYLLSAGVIILMVITKFGGRL